jgi:ATP-binding cassette, subfamily B, multidrug efflux pump
MSDAVDSSGIRFGKIWPIITPWRLLLTGALVSVLVGAGLSLFPPLIMRRLIDEHLVVGRVEDIFTLALIYLGATIAIHLTSFLTAYSTSVAAQGALRRLRVRLFGHLQKLPVSYYDRTPIGDTISRCTADMETIDTLFSSGVISLLAESVRLLFTLGAMIALSLPLSLVLILTLPLLVIFSRRFQILMRGAQRALRKDTGVLNAHLQEILTRPEVIKVFGWEFRIVQRFRRVLADTLRAQNRSIAYGAMYDPLFKIFQAALVALFLIATASPVLEIFHVSIGTLIAFILLFDQFFGPLISIGNEWQVVQGALAGLERIFEVLALPADEGQTIRASYRGGVTRPERVLVEVEGVTFGYAEDRPVLREISLRVDAGFHVAIVGRTGAGKSSLFHLLGGLYRPWKGCIRLEGKDPNEIHSSDRRRILGTVPQSGWMFSGSVAENLTLWDDTISRDAVEKAGHISGADTFIEKFSSGYDTTISDAGRGQGLQLSAGEKQLLALTRALVGDPSVLLLDEATAAVDSATEAAFKRALRIQLEERQGVVITIAHRISTAMEANCIVVLEDGRIVEEGAPDDLIQNGGPFAALWVLENAGWDWREKQKG